MRTDDDLVDVLAGEHREAALVQVHEGQVAAAALRDVLVRVQPNQYEVALLLRPLRAATKTLTHSEPTRALSTEERQVRRAMRRALASSPPIRLKFPAAQSPEVLEP